MPPTLLLIRHAQAQHNATSDWSIRDPPLTELGEQQSRELQESLKQSKIGNEVDLIVVSAQRRTLQTATIGLDWLIKKGTKGNKPPSTLLYEIERWRG
jgi:broad specificity phosphatase PhoE